MRGAGSISRGLAGTHRPTDDRSCGSRPSAGSTIHPMLKRRTFIERARAFGERPAVIQGNRVVTYARLAHRAGQMAGHLLQGESDLKGRRVAFLLPPGSDYVALQWAVWAAGGIAVPLCVSHPRPELETVIKDSGADVVVVDPAIQTTGGPPSLPAVHVWTVPELCQAEPMDEDRLKQDRSCPDAMILYTSGTTGKPKGVVLSHANLICQVEMLVSSWGWLAGDRILHVLPLHHVHGIVNALCCPLWVGASCRFLQRFDPQSVWEQLMGGEISVLMAVPTMYVRLIQYWRKQPAGRRRALSKACRDLRLMVSGSAALPAEVFHEWESISGHALLERYGMTEIGMALSNPLQGERRPGTVGQTIPGVEVRLVDDAGRPIPGHNQSGEIEVRGASVFSRYWEADADTRRAFRDGWFRTGDAAIVEDGYWRILGRKSVDIIKTGGYKVSALEIESALLAHPEIEEVCVVGTQDAEWGERVCAVFVDSPGPPVSLKALRDWAKERLAPYKIPNRLVVVKDLPRNAMGKINKIRVTMTIREGDVEHDEMHR